MRPSTIDEASEAFRELSGSGRSVAIRGGATKRSWSGRGRPVLELRTGGLRRILEHNAGDLTAVLEAGVPLAEAQEEFGLAGQMLAIDPPLGADRGATVGGIVAAADSGPMRHRYGTMRDLVIGMTVVLSSGTRSKSGGRVIKNVAGYDVAKLFAGSHGSLGMIASVTVRLHPLEAESVTVLAECDDPGRLVEAAALASRLPLEAECLDVHWDAGAGRLLIRLAGVAAAERAAAVGSELRALGLDHVREVSDDDSLWVEQRNLQRRAGGLVLKVAGLAGDLPAVLASAERLGGTAISRAALGVSYLSFPAGGDPASTVAAARGDLAPRACTVLDGAELVGVPAWPPADPAATRVMERLKRRLDPDEMLAPVPIGAAG